MINHLEAGIRELVEEFQSNGKPCPSKLPIADRRAGYIGKHRTPITFRFRK